MKNELIYDVYAMKLTVREARRLVNDIRRGIASLRNTEYRETEAQGLPVQAVEKLQALEKICHGYESVLRNMEAAANLYGTAEAAAQELITF